MPRIRRHNLPESLLIHLAKRIRERQISAEQLTLLARWLETEPSVPEGKWFRKFAGFTVCGQGELVKTFLLPGQSLTGSTLAQAVPSVVTGKKG